MKDLIGKDYIGKDMPIDQSLAHDRRSWLAATLSRLMEDTVDFVT
jgi:hypothetical protein